MLLDGFGTSYRSGERLKGLVIQFRLKDPVKEESSDNGEAIPHVVKIVQNNPTSC